MSPHAVKTETLLDWCHKADEHGYNRCVDTEALTEVVRAGDLHAVTLSFPHTNFEGKESIRVVVSAHVFDPVPRHVVLTLDVEPAAFYKWQSTVRHPAGLDYRA